MGDLSISLLRSPSVAESLANDLRDHTGRDDCAVVDPGDHALSLAFGDLDDDGETRFVVRCDDPSEALAVNVENSSSRARQTHHPTQHDEAPELEYPLMPHTALTGPAIVCRSGINELRPTETAERRVIGTGAFWPNLYGSQPDAPPARIYSEVLDGWIESRKTEVERWFPRWRST
ncbi:hypothetical protein ACFV4K_27930 [Nocardia sp. NPDC059764]|uniref:hypothetical protein n=1 Tax=Nocardia sp. NPDC059764 TaxID=3346939 RepID=UPI0036497FF8